MGSGEIRTPIIIAMSIRHASRNWVRECLVESIRMPRVVIGIRNADMSRQRFSGVGSAGSDLSKDAAGRTGREFERTNLTEEFPDLLEAGTPWECDGAMIGDWTGYDLSLALSDRLQHLTERIEGQSLVLRRCARAVALLILLSLLNLALLVFVASH
jgi:hypothetical protein